MYMLGCMRASKMSAMAQLQAVTPRHLMSLTDQNGRHTRGRWQQHGDHPRSCRGDKCLEGPQRCSCHNGRVQGNKSLKERYGARLSLPSCVSNHTHSYLKLQDLFSHTCTCKRVVTSGKCCRCSTERYVCTVVKVHFHLSDPFESGKKLRNLS